MLSTINCTTFIKKYDLATVNGNVTHPNFDSPIFPSSDGDRTISFYFEVLHQWPLFSQYRELQGLLLG